MLSRHYALLAHHWAAAERWGEDYAGWAAGGRPKWAPLVEAYSTAKDQGVAAFFTPRASLTGLAIGFALSFLLVLFVRTDLWVILDNFGCLTNPQVSELPNLSRVLAMEVADGKLQGVVNSVWTWPITVFLTWGCGLLIPRPGEPPGTLRFVAALRPWG